MDYSRIAGSMNCGGLKEGQIAEVQAGEIMRSGDAAQIRERTACPGLIGPKFLDKTSGVETSMAS